MPDFIYTTTALNAATVSSTAPYTSATIDLFDLPKNANGPPLGSASIQLLSVSSSGSMNFAIHGSLSGTTFHLEEDSGNIVSAATAPFLADVTLPFARYVRFVVSTTSTGIQTVTMLASFK